MRLRRKKIRIEPRYGKIKIVVILNHTYVKKIFRM